MTGFINSMMDENTVLIYNANIAYLTDTLVDQCGSEKIRAIFDRCGAANTENLPAKSPFRINMLIYTISCTTNKYIP